MTKLVTKCESYSEEEQIKEQRTESKKPCEQQRTENAFEMNFADSMFAPLQILNHRKSGNPFPFYKFCFWNAKPIVGRRSKDQI